MTPNGEPDLYAVLGVPSDADRSAIIRAFRRRAFAGHPDRGGDAETFRRLQRARETLLDPARRAAYDRRRTAPPTPGAAGGAATGAAGEPAGSRARGDAGAGSAPPAAAGAGSAADPFAWEPGAGPGAGPPGTEPAADVSFPGRESGRSWRREDRFSWWRTEGEPPPERPRRRR
ncbi:J domain-containing protein [Streptomyces sp. NRRL F-5065]|uniref:J domain-containing protein n=1 Tax=Streptomyces sp. NRRL F-5065 TaxID=1463855 RepID=UPI0004BE77CF|nr:J domain-containing protein [Streptomyces sp. NRRL F-5065]